MQCKALPRNGSPFGSFVRLPFPTIQAMASTSGSSAVLRWFLLTTLLAIAIGQALELGDDCLTRAGDRGRCVEIERCGPLLARRERSNNKTEALGDFMCGDTTSPVLVCCSRNSTLPEPPQCGTQSAFRKLLHTQAHINELPWMALIEYTHYDGRTIYYCDGVLIDARNILTAAHCLEGFPKTLRLERVRLGEWNVSSSIDCEEEYCTDAPVDQGIGKIIVHPDYRRGDWNHGHDIALVRFTRDVTYSETIRPICLPSVELLSSNSNRSPVIVAGWEEEVKGWAYSTIRPQEQCASSYRTQQLLTIQPEHLCVGDPHEPNNCRYTAGSPLVQQINGSWYVRGIGCVQPSSCASTVGNLYTDVLEYVEWIRDNVY
uniref:CLIP domain-containing serine protease n=1 Tax=Anopheles farauti TaxID=69004 RepID=A0A182QFP1_9DIPT